MLRSRKFAFGHDDGRPTLIISYAPRVGAIVRRDDATDLPKLRSALAANVTREGSRNSGNDRDTWLRVRPTHTDPSLVSDLRQPAAWSF